MFSRRQKLVKIFDALDRRLSHIEQTQDRQDRLLGEIKTLLIENNRTATDHRTHSMQAISDLGADVKEVRKRLDRHLRESLNGDAT